MSRTTVADVIVDGLARAGTPRIFLAPAAGPGRELADAARRHGLPIVTVSGAGVACLMAAVTAELSDAPGAAVVSFVPDVVSEAASALTARVPLLLLTDDAPRDAGSCDSLASSAGAGATVRSAARPAAAGVAERSVRLESDSATDAFAHALVLAMTEPRGPVQVRLSADLLARDAPRIMEACRPGLLPAPDPAALDAAARLLGRAARPVLVAGRGSRRPEAVKWLRALAEALPAPVLVTPSAKGVIPDPHPLAFGVLGNRIGAALVARSDLVVAIGVDEGEVVPSWWPAAPAISLGPRALEDVRPAVRVVGEIPVILEELAPRLRARERADWDVAELDRLKRQLAAPLGHDAPFGPTRIVELAREATAAGTIAAVDAGPFRDAALGRWHAIGPLELLAPPEPARRGFALPAALAAALCHPDRRVLCLADAEPLTRQTAELALAVRLALPIVIVAAGPSTGDVAAVTRGLAIPTLTAENTDAFHGALGRALADALPALIAVPAETAAV